MDEDLKILIASTAAETRRHFDVVGERLESKLQVIADGVIAVDRRIGHFEATMRAEFADVKSMLELSESSTHDASGVAASSRCVAGRRPPDS